MLVHSYVDPFKVDMRATRQREVTQLRRTVATLEAEITRLESRIHALYLAQQRIPAPDASRYDDHEMSDYLAAECAWDDVWNVYDMKQDRLIKRVDAMSRNAL